MRLKLFKGRVSTLLIRSGWILKIAITCTLSLSLVTFWWFFVQKRINLGQKDAVFKIADLSQQKIIFDEALSQYYALHQKIKSKNIGLQFDDPDTLNSCQVIIDQSRIANLILQTYTAKKLKDNYKQMIFSFVGGYTELLKFLHNLDQVGIGVNCNKLRIAAINHKLQIAYVCGIHTSVK